MREIREHPIIVILLFLLIPPIGLLVGWPMLRERRRLCAVLVIYGLLWFGAVSSTGGTPNSQQNQTTYESPTEASLPNTMAVGSSLTTDIFKARFNAYATDVGLPFVIEGFRVSKGTPYDLYRASILDSRVMITLKCSRTTTKVAEVILSSIFGSQEVMYDAGTSMIGIIAACNPELSGAEDRRNVLLDLGLDGGWFESRQTVRGGNIYSYTPEDGSFLFDVVMGRSE